jgi:hypothetical protein
VDVQLGFAVGTAGDVNGDGFADVIVGAPNHHVFVYYGSASGLSAVAAWTAGSLQALDYYGYTVGTAGDVNGDGYSDVIVGAPGTGQAGRAFVYHGSASGLSLTPNWTKEIADQPAAFFGLAAGTAGDVNGDGYSDVIVSSYIRAYVYHGSPSGLPAIENWSAEVNGSPPEEEPQCAAGTAGDVNGDGYSDVVVGAPNFFDPLTESVDSRVFVYPGSASGLSPTASFTASSQTTYRFGSSASAAGDVNGDGYSDLIVGAYKSNQEGGTFVYFGGGGVGGSLRPQQRRADDAAPVAPMGTSGSPDTVRLSALGRTPFGRGRVKLEWEIKPLGIPFNGSGLQSSAGWLDTGTGAVALNEAVTGLAANSVHHWRVRLRYHPGTTPFQSRGRWFTTAGNGWQEGDFRTQMMIGDRVWQDMDGDGIQDAGEPGVANALVALYDGAGALLDSTLTSASGSYAFLTLSIGSTYQLRFLPPPTYVLTAKDQGGDDLSDSDADPVTQLTPAFVLSGPDRFRWDAGLIPSCLPPDERIFISTVTQSTDGNHYPILNFQDPNQLSQITGYNVRRSSNRALPPATWPLVASDIIDMDQGTPNKQWVDSSGDVSPSGIWYYQVTAVNSRCPAEGPF